jgi:hypothetical protein
MSQDMSGGSIHTAADHSSSGECRCCGDRADGNGAEQSTENRRDAAEHQPADQDHHWRSKHDF